MPATTTSASPVMLAPVKLVVWDLDETLWSGTLSEGPVRLEDGRAELLRALVDRGVMVAISSRNDPAGAQAELERLGLWHLFVFPRINWQAKGVQVRDLIAAAQLRQANVLFVDDNHLNREEVRHFCPGIQVADPGDPAFGLLLGSVLDAGTPDPDRRRLRQYRQLQARTEEAADFDDNFEFLRTCDIRVTIRRAEIPDAPRIHDLIARANQLNYTKRRVDLATLRATLRDASASSWVVDVADRFGEEGLVGIAVVRDGRAEHFAFSCRILGMGVERAVHRELGRPAVETVEPVSTPLDGPDPDWLTIVRSDRPPTVAASPTSPVTPPDLVFVGGCDLESVIAFLPDRDRIATHFNAGHTDNPRIVVHGDSIDFLLADGLAEADRAFILETVPFVDASVFATPDWSAYRHVVYSPLIDYVQAKYTSDRLPGFYLSYGDVEAPVIDDARIAQLADRGVDPAAVRRFVETWAPVTKPEAEWASQLHALFARMAAAETVTVLLGATRTFDGLDAARLPLHRRANALITRVARSYPNVRLVPVDAAIKGPADFRDGIRHYSRRVYAELAAAIGPGVGRATVPIAALDGQARDAHVGNAVPDPIRRLGRGAVQLIRRRAGV